jgi:hypothetical protein
MHKMKNKLNQNPIILHKMRTTLPILQKQTQNNEKKNLFDPLYKILSQISKILSKLTAFLKILYEILKLLKNYF